MKRVSTPHAHGSTAPPLHRRLAVWAIGVGLAVVGISVGSGPRLGEWLVVSEPPAQADAIIVLGGGSRQRLQTAVKLWREGYAPILLLSGGAPGTGPLTQAETMAAKARLMGVPARDLLLDNRSTTTFQNALDTLPLLYGRRATSALVVSSDYHMRRVEFLFAAVYASSGIRLRFVAAPSLRFHSRRWWSTPQSACITVSEYAKLAVNVVEVVLWEMTRFMRRLGM